MGYYKIKNITNDLGKRHPKLNTSLTIDFNDKITSNSVTINPGFEITIDTNYLPISAQKLRTEGLITITEIDKNTYQKLLNSQENKGVVESKQKNTTTETSQFYEKQKKFKQKSK